MTYFRRHFFPEFSVDAGAPSVSTPQRGRLGFGKLPNCMSNDLFREAMVLVAHGNCSQADYDPHS